MIKFKVCPRCQGDLYLSEDIFGKYFSCMQCGYLKDIDKPRQDKDIDKPRLDSRAEGDAVLDAELEVA